VLLLLAGSAIAAEQQGPAMYTLSLPGQDMLVIQKGLLELPYKESSPVLLEMQKQLQFQTNEWHKAHPAKTEKPK
jgi:hypothetical protein